MGILRRLLTLPISGPISGASWIAGQIQNAAEAEFYDPAAIRRALLALESRLDRGEIDEDAFEAEELVLLERLQQARRAGA